MFRGVGHRLVESNCLRAVGAMASPIPFLIPAALALGLRAKVSRSGIAKGVEFSIEVLAFDERVGGALDYPECFCYFRRVAVFYEECSGGF